MAEKKAISEFSFNCYNGAGSSVLRWHFPSALRSGFLPPLEGAKCCAFELDPSLSSGPQTTDDHHGRPPPTSLFIQSPDSTVGSATRHYQLANPPRSTLPLATPTLATLQLLHSAIRHSAAIDSATRFLPLAISHSPLAISH